MRHLINTLPRSGHGVCCNTLSIRLSLARGMSRQYSIVYIAYIASRDGPGAINDHSSIVGNCRCRPSDPDM